MLAAGFDGIEARLPLQADERVEFGAFLRSNRVPYICTLFSAYDVLPDQNATPARHLADIDRKLGWATELTPRFVNLLAGNDRWPQALQVEFFGQAMELAARHGVFCSFETHRARSLYSPWVTLELIRQLPRLRFTSDISHWVVCCERLLALGLKEGYFDALVINNSLVNRVFTGNILHHTMRIITTNSLSATF